MRNAWSNIKNIKSENEKDLIRLEELRSVVFILDVLRQPT